MEQKHDSVETGYVKNVKTNKAKREKNNFNNSKPYQQRKKEFKKPYNSENSKNETVTKDEKKKVIEKKNDNKTSTFMPSIVKKVIENLYKDEIPNSNKFTLSNDWEYPILELTHSNEFIIPTGVSNVLADIISSGGAVNKYKMLDIYRSFEGHTTCKVFLSKQNLIDYFDKWDNFVSDLKLPSDERDLFLSVIDLSYRKNKAAIAFTSKGEMIQKKEPSRMTNLDHYSMELIAVTELKVGNFIVLYNSIKQLYLIFKVAHVEPTKHMAVLRIFNICEKDKYFLKPYPVVEKMVESTFKLLAYLNVSPSDK